MVPELRGERIFLNAHTDDDVVAHVAGEDEETARRFGWWPKQSTEETVRAADRLRGIDWRNPPGSTHRARPPRLTARR
jgi:hypothetical protein